MSRGVTIARSSSESLFYSVTSSVGERSGRAWASRKIDGTRETFTSTVLGTWLPVHIFQTSVVFFSHCKQSSIFFAWRGQNRLTFRYLILWHLEEFFRYLSRSRCVTNIVWPISCLESSVYRSTRISTTSWPPQEKLFIWPPFFQYNKRPLRQKMGGACLYMPQDGHWLASFEVIPPPPKVSFPAAKKMKIPHWKLKTVFLIQFCFWKFWRFTVFAAKILSRRSRLSRWSRAPSRLIRPRPILDGKNVF